TQASEVRSHFREESEVLFVARPEVSSDPAVDAGPRLGAPSFRPCLVDRRFRHRGQRRAPRGARRTDAESRRARCGYGPTGGADMTRMRTLISSATTVGILAAAPIAQTDRKPSLVLEKVNGKIELRSGPDAPRSVDENKDRGRVLYEGDVLMCGDGASFSVLNAAFEERRIDNCRSGYVVSAPTGASAAVLERYGRTGGRSRG